MVVSHYLYRIFSKIVIGISGVSIICHYESIINRNDEILDWKLFPLNDLPEIGFEHQKEVLGSLNNKNIKY